ncbi:MAG: tRNA uridine-5-carboxymethylaminomethyl(34) synthesis GTPase MnmE [Thiogranum sp.]|jgi:tRNA modification GTPase|nr:tRNA uridine-5-carboxymethylaminomethyl(34) synthesis GTPase MnmE [Thiogranum sp.]
MPSPTREDQGQDAGTDAGADSIAAIATPPGRGGVGIVRVSGPGVPALAGHLLGHLPLPRQAGLQHFTDARGELIDTGLALYFPAPYSFTGEHVLELHGHGGPVVMDLLLARVLELGARPARPGEFSERAFLNDKLDLTQAEAIADLIDSSTASAARAATRSLQGEFSRRVHALTRALVELRTFVEAAIDFPEEEIDFLGDGEVQGRLGGVADRLQELLGDARQGCLLREGMTVVLAGRPNVGKSSILNSLAGRDAAIVTPVAGTTRDVLREHIQIDSMPLHVIDTAGLRDSDDPVEQEGVRRAWAQIEQADRILLVIDDQLGFKAEDQALLQRLPATLPCTRIVNKIDLSGCEPGLRQTGDRTEVALSARSGAGMDDLRRHLKAVMGYTDSSAGGFSARRRHLDALRRACTHLDNAQACLRNGSGELLAEELRLAQQHMSEITGEFSSDDLLGEIFSSFCIGK